MDFNNVNETEPDGEEQLVFYYNREERIKNSPQIVKDYYDGKITAFKPGLFKALTATKGNRITLFVLVVCFAVVLFTGIFNKRNEGNVAGVPVALSAFSFEEKVYVSLKFDEAKKNSAGQNIPYKAEIIFQDADKQPVSTETFTVNYQGKECFIRTTCNDYDIFYVGAVVTHDDIVQELYAAVEKR